MLVINFILIILKLKIIIFSFRKFNIFQKKFKKIKRKKIFKKNINNLIDDINEFTLKMILFL